MKKYKLIKEYPGIVTAYGYKLGDIVKEFEYMNTIFYNKLGNAFEPCLLRSTVENYPEFWEEVKEDKFVTVYGVNESFTKTASCFKHKIKQDYAAGNWIWFDTEKERDEYIEYYKPQFSKSEMIDFCKSVWYKKSLSDTSKGLYDYLEEWINKKKK